MAGAEFHGLLEKAQKKVPVLFDEMKMGTAAQKMAKRKFGLQPDVGIYQLPSTTPCRHCVETVSTYKTETRLRRRPDQTVTKTKLKLRLRTWVLKNS